MFFGLYIDRIVLIRFQELAIRAKRRAQLIKEGKISDPDNRGTLENAIVFEAKCMNMCPEFECLERKHQKYVDVYETVSYGKCWTIPPANII